MASGGGDEVEVNGAFIGAGCNIIVNNVPWGACDLVAFGAQNADAIAIAIFSPKLVIRLKTGVEMKVLTPLKPFPMQFLTFLLNLPLNINWHGIHFGQSRTNFMMIMGMSYFLYVVISWGSLLLHPVSFIDQGRGTKESLDHVLGTHMVMSLQQALGIRLRRYGL